MPTWLWIFIILAGGLFGLKMTYILCTALVLPITQGALYVSTSRVRIKAFIEAVPMKPGQLLVDLGCGDGRVLRQVRKHYNVNTVGYEVNLIAYLKARVLCIGLKGIEIRRENFWPVDLSGADVVFCYLYPDVMKKLSDKLRKNLKSGTGIVSCNFALPGFKPTRVLRSKGSWHNAPLYFYQIQGNN
jgi:hypothetical protein